MSIGMWLFGHGGPKKENYFELWNGPQRQELIRSFKTGYYWARYKYPGFPANEERNNFWFIGYYDREFNSVWYFHCADRDFEWEHIICVGPEIIIPMSIAP